MLVAGGVQPSEVKMIFTPTAFQAAAAFNAREEHRRLPSRGRRISTTSSKVKGNRMLVTTATANKLIADVWFARADFAKDHPDIVEGLVRGIFDAMEELKQDASQAKGRRADGRRATTFRRPTRSACSATPTAPTGRENYQFFVNQNNPTNFERVWNQAYYLYRAGRHDHAISRCRSTR